MTPRPRSVALSLVVLLCLSGLTPQAGSILDRGGYSFHGPYAGNPGHMLASLAKDRWQDACVPVHFSLNTTADPILDPDGQPAMSLADAREGVVGALHAWNSIPTSYIEMRLDGETHNPGEPTFDFVNEITFSSQVPVLGGITAYSRSYFVLLDSTLQSGWDIDGDGDPDVTSPSSTCRDVDGDGDIEVPAGKYAAGTILDTDVVMSTNNAYFADLVKNPIVDPLSDFRVDLQGIAAHEFGHSHGLGHSNLVDSSITDGTSATMTSTGAFDGFLHLRSLHADDVAWSSYWYPEGSTKKGPGALQRGDVAFEKRYALISGEVRDKLGRPIVGATPYAVSLDGEIVAAALSGTVRVAVDPVTLALGNIDRNTAMHDGRYTLPVPRGIYWVGIEADDGLPSVDGANFTHGIARIFGQPVFPEEYWSGPFESANELASGFAWPVLALSNRKNVDFVIDEAEELLAANGDPAAAFAYSVEPGGIIAVRMPAGALRDFAGDRSLLIKAAVFGLVPWINEEMPSLPSVMLTTGRVLPDGSVSIDLDHPLVRQRGFTFQDRELTPWHFLSSEWLGSVVTRQLAPSGRDLFLVAHFPTTVPPFFEQFGIVEIGVLAEEASPEHVVGDTYYSADGGATFFKTVVDAYFGLVVAKR